jgi:hypothetical protein
VARRICNVQRDPGGNQRRDGTSHGKPGLHQNRYVGNRAIGLLVRPACGVSSLHLLPITTFASAASTRRQPGDLLWQAVESRDVTGARLS